MSNIEEGSRGDNATEVADLEEGTNLEEKPSPNVTAATRNNGKLRSVVWNHFKHTELGGGFRRAVCKYCGHEYPKISSKSGTGNLKRHLEGYSRKNSHDVRQLVSLGAKSKFEPEYFRELLCRDITMHDLPF